MLYAALLGMALSSIFITYTGASIARVFFISAATFGAMSLWGYTTQRDLTGMGSFLLMGLVGVIVASLVNIFLASSMLQFIVSVVGVLVFAGLTAWDTQRLKNEYIYGAMEGEVAERAAIIGALSLYLIFINLFMASSMLQFIISVVGVLVFAGLTACDTQRLKSEYLYGAMDGETAERSSIIGVLSLHLNFINLFTPLLQLLVQREE